MIDLGHLPLIAGEIADYKYEPNGILYSYSKSIKRSVENIGNNIQLVKEISGGKKVPLLIYLCESPMPDKETRKFSAEQLPHVYTAMAMVSKPGLSKLIMSVLFKFQKAPIPMRSFSNDEEARNWLKQYI